MLATQGDSRRGTAEDVVGREGCRHGILAVDLAGLRPRRASQVLAISSRRICVFPLQNGFRSIGVEHPDLPLSGIASMLTNGDELVEVLQRSATRTLPVDRSRPNGQVPLSGKGGATASVWSSFCRRAVG